jgi:peptidoglycan pentaglycine glycine transferase (the first glycine)
MTTTIEEITDREQWNSFLISQTQGHLFQSYEWGELTQYQGQRIYRVGALEDGRLIGTMLLAVSPIPLPVTVQGIRFHWLYSRRGPSVERPDTLVALVEHAHTIAQQERAVALRVEPNIADDDPQMEEWIRTYQALGFRADPLATLARRSWVLDIRPDAEQLLANFERAWRKNVRIARRKGVLIREADSERDFDTYYDLLTVTSERADFFIHSKDFHQQMLRQFAQKGDAVLYLAEHEGEALAAMMLMRFGNWCWGMFGASSKEKRNLKPNYLLQYHCLLWAKSHGCDYFDFRGIPDVLELGEEMWGVYQFKRGFGGFSRLHIPTQAYIYRPLIYHSWRKVAQMLRARHRARRKRLELSRAARGKN